MPLIANSTLPSFDRLQQEGELIIPDSAAIHQDIRELHIGLLNMMPDQALEATERQFFRLIGGSNQIAQLYIHPFTINEIDRSDKGRAHVERYYQDFEEIKKEGLDALIITGSNVVGTELSEQVFWGPLVKILDWAYENVTSTLCSCLATHAVMQFRYGQRRSRLARKCWGVFPHRVIDRTHPLVVKINTRFDIPHSRFNEISPAQFAQAGLKILVKSEHEDVHLAVSEDGFRIIFFQAHPEYDTISLMKEYKREIGRYIRGEITHYPPFPKNYFSSTSQAVLEEYQQHIQTALAAGYPVPEFPETLLTPQLDNTWHDTAAAIMSNWMGKIYQLTHIDRHRPFLEGIAPEDPLSLKKQIV